MTAVAVCWADTSTTEVPTHAAQSTLPDASDLGHPLRFRPDPRRAGSAVDLAITHRITQGIQARPIKPGATVAFITEDMAVVQVVAVGLGPGAQGDELAVDGLLALLAFGGDAGIDGGMHDASPSAGPAVAAGRDVAMGTRRRR